ncbi:SprB repeat-containing protein [Flaviaesturariibacter terrae]
MGTLAHKSALLFAATLLAACSKSTSDNNTTNPDPCSGVTIQVTGSVTPASAGQSNGAISATASGASGFTFSKDGTNFQASGSFSNLAAGSYTITARSSGGCTGSAAFTVGTVSTCAGVTITVNPFVSANVPCGGNNGSITVTASGGVAPYNYSINGGSFQSGNVFNSLAAGSYSLLVRDANGCTSVNTTASVGNAPAGSLFSTVRSIVQANCAVSGCHDAATQQNGINFSDACQIVSHASAIKLRAVDQAGTPQQMPQPPRAPLTASERAAISNWVSAGGGYTN